MVRSCILCLALTNLPEWHIPVCLRCRKDLQLADPAVRMQIAAQAWSAAQAADLNRNLSLLAEALRDCAQMTAAVTNIVQPSQN